MDSYKTVKAYGEAEFVERRSRFISVAIPVTSEEQAVALINERRSKHWDATHNVYAYSLREGNVRRYSDDAEPQGTAGMPTLDVLVKSGVTDVLVITTRYFGGVLLGAGGLVRAYSHSASIALEAAGIIEMNEVVDCELETEYFMYGKIDSLLSGYGVIDKLAEFAQGVKISFSVKADDLGKLRKELTDLSGGKVDIVEISTRFAAFE